MIRRVETVAPAGHRFAQYFVTPSLTNANGGSIAVESLLELSSRFVIVGSAGIGKTTLLSYLAYRQAHKYQQEGRFGNCPILVAGRDFHRVQHIENFISKISTILSEQIGRKVESEDLIEVFKSGSASLLVDGLDEIEGNENRAETLLGLNDFSRRFSKPPILLSSRPSALSVSFSGFTYAHLTGFNNEQVRQFVVQLAHDSPEMAVQFLNGITLNRSIEELAASPLLLSLLWNIFKVNGRIPTNPAFLYSDFTDYLLSTWEVRKGIGARTSLTLDIKHQLLEQIALYLFEREQIVFTKEEVNKIATGLLNEIQTIDENDLAIVNDLLSTSLLVRVDNNSFRFAHLSFVEYYTARAIRRDPQKVTNLVSKHGAHDIVMFACGLVDDIAPIVEAAIERKYMILAAKCISHGRTKNQKLTEYVVREFAREVGSPFIDLLISTKDERQGRKEDIYSTLMRKWDLFSEPSCSSHEKGRRFEEFASDLFAQVFRVVSRDLNTENGELDIVLEIIKSDPFWMEFGGDALVECKNWASHTPLKEVGAFAHKVAQGRVKLAFFISISGFTEDAERTLKNHASNINAPLIVPIDGKSINSVLQRREYFEEFFKERIRAIKYLRKY